MEKSVFWFLAFKYDFSVSEIVVRIICTARKYLQGAIGLYM